MTALDEWALIFSSTALPPRAPVLTTWTRPSAGQVAADSRLRGRRAKLRLGLHWLRLEEELTEAAVDQHAGAGLWSAFRCHDEGFGWP